MSILTLLGYSVTFGGLFITMIVGHVFTDHIFQSHQMLLGKDHKHVTEFGEQYGTLWPLFLSSHALVNAAGVTLITGSVLLGVAEFVVHWIIDYAKNERCDFGYLTDQVLHIISKLAWAVLASNSMFTLA